MFRESHVKTGVKSDHRTVGGGPKMRDCPLRHPYLPPSSQRISEGGHNPLSQKTEYVIKLSKVL